MFKDNMRNKSTEFNDQRKETDEKIEDEMKLEKNTNEDTQLGSNSCSSAFKEKEDNLSNNLEQNSCTKCKATFEDSHEFKQHTCQGRAYICGACHSGFTRLCYLKRHICSDVANESNSKAEMSMNASDSNYNNQIVDNDNTKQPLNNSSMESNIGNYRNAMETESNSRKRKVATDSIKNKKFKCPSCNKTYARQHYLDKHMFEHKESKPWSCMTCDATFNSIAKYKNHCKTAHGIIKPFKCEKCEKFFASKEVLRVHDRTHTGDRPFKCDKCGDAFKQSSNLFDHLRKHNNDRAFICGTCGKAFNLKGDLTKHLQLHTGEKPYKCTYCPMAFPRVSNLNRHLNTHTGARRFACSHCDKSFARKEKLRDHERTHTGEKPFICEICGKGFSDSGNFSNHKRAHREPGFKHGYQRKSSSKAANTVTLQEMINSQVPVIDVNDNCPSYTVNIENCVTSTQQTLIFNIPDTFLCYVDKPKDGNIGIGSNEQLLFQVQGTDDSNSQSVYTLSSIQGSNYEQDVQLANDRDSNCLDASEIREKKQAIDVPLCTVIQNDSSSSQTQDSNASNQVELSVHPQSEQAFTNCLTAVGSLSPKFSTNMAMNTDLEAPLVTSLPDDKDTSVNVNDDRTALESDHLISTANEDKYLNLVSTPVTSDGPEGFYAAAHLTLTDLAGQYELQGYSYNPNTVLIASTGDSASGEINDNILATPTKTIDYTKSAFICSQVLVTPEHHLSKDTEKQRASVDTISRSLKL